MRHLLIFLLALSLFAVPATAQDAKTQDDAAIYIVTDVPTDVTADSAAHARDQAVMQAQRTAFSQLLNRLNAPDSVAKKLSDDDIATLVKSFEVQAERTSSVRYLGTFTVEFKPNAVRKYLDSQGVQEDAGAQDSDTPVTVENARPTVSQEPTTRLPMTVAINSLPEWAQIKHKLDSIPLITHTDVITLQRGSTSIEIEFHGSIDALQFALNQQNLFLRQDGLNQAWTLRPLQITGGN